jgi:hypothetical protein
MFQAILDHLRQAASAAKTLEEPAESHPSGTIGTKAPQKGKKLHYKSLPAIVNMKKLPTDLTEQ